MSAEVAWSIISKNSASRTLNNGVVFDRNSVNGTGFAKHNKFGAKKAVSICSCTDRKNAKIALVKRSIGGVSKQFIGAKNGVKVIKAQLATYRPDVIKATVRAFKYTARANARRSKAAKFIASLKK